MKIRRPPAILGPGNKSCVFARCGSLKECAPSAPYPVGLYPAHNEPEAPFPRAMCNLVTTDTHCSYQPAQQDTVIVCRTLWGMIVDRLPHAQRKCNLCFPTGAGGLWGAFRGGILPLTRGNGTICASHPKQLGWFATAKLVPCYVKDQARRFGRRQGRVAVDMEAMETQQFRRSTAGYGRDAFQKPVGNRKG